MPVMHWDLFCRVVDNFGDAGVCWRTATDLASRGETVRLWIDDARPLTWMAPSRHPGVELRSWPDDHAAPTPGDVVIEAFGCDLPPGFVARMAAAARPPVWINFEYLSAEDYVERCHGLPSPQSAGPAAGLVKWFFYPGFTPRTGGLLREPDVMARQRRFDAARWLRAQGVAWGGERRVSLFCYRNAALPALLNALAAEPTLLLATAGEASAQVAEALGPGLTRGGLRAVLLPHLPQPEYDHLLWASDVNFVRGEDSFVRAQWAARPFVWQIYPQHDEAHALKLQAYTQRFLANASLDLANDVASLWKWWNALSPLPPRLPPLQAWQHHCERWRQTLLAQEDLVTQLLGFVNRKR